jgi:hypothetical protein
MTITPTHATAPSVAVGGDRVVGHAMWCATRYGLQRAEIAFVIAKDRRGQGRGHRLTRLAITDAVRGGRPTSRRPCWPPTGPPGG